MPEKEVTSSEPHGQDAAEPGSKLRSDFQAPLEGHRLRDPRRRSGRWLSGEGHAHARSLADTALGYTGEICMTTQRLASGRSRDVLASSLTPRSSQTRTSPGHTGSPAGLATPANPWLPARWRPPPYHPVRLQFGRLAAPRANRVLCP